MQAGGPPHLSQSIFHGVELRIRIARFQKTLPQRCHTTMSPERVQRDVRVPYLIVGTGPRMESSTRPERNADITYFLPLFSGVD